MMSPAPQDQFMTLDSRYQPAALAHGFWMNGPHHLKVALPHAVYFFATQDETQHWNIDYLLGAYQGKNDFVFQTNELGHPFGYACMGGLSTTQKDHIMTTLKDENLLCRGYHEPDKLEELLLERQTPPIACLDAAPPIITTKSVLLPPTIPRMPGDKDMLAYYKTDISPAAMRQSGLSGTTKGILQSYAENFSDTLYPASFFAMKIEPERDEWTIFCRGPYSLQAIISLPYISRTCQFLQEMEQFAINPKYQTDSLLQDTSARLQEFADFNPLHHSKIVIRQNVVHLS